MGLLEGRRPFVLLLAAFLGALGSAYILEYFFGFRPCSLCLYQRYGLMGLAGFCGLFLCVPPTSFLQKLGLSLLCVGLLASSSLAFYQILVERKVVEAPKVCRLQTKATTVEEFLAQAKTQTVVPCDKPQGTFLGLTLTVYSLLFSLGLFGYTGLSLYTRYARQSHDIHPSSRRCLP